MSVSTFPKIVRFLETIDAPGSQCPHCGAEGRYILRFQVEDGRILGAMRGCVKLFPVSRVAIEELRLREKLKKYIKLYGPGATLSKRDNEAVDTIDAYYRGERDERSTLSVIDSIKRANQARYRR